MTHYLKTSKGEKFQVEMGCTHPDMENNNAANVGCDGECGKCKHSIAKMTIPDFFKLLKDSDSVLS